MESPAIDAPSYARASSGAPPNKDCREAPRNAWQAIRKGLRGCCPNCGEGKMFRSYLKVNDACPHCGEELFHQRADDAPPYMTIFVVGHIIGTFMILVEEYWPAAPIWLHAMVWPTITLILSLWLLPIIKGGLIGHQCALRMHGFETVGRAATGQSLDNRTDRWTGGTEMVKRFDHLTIVVRDIDRAKAFFSVLGFKEAISVVIAGEPFASYMGVPGIEAEHVTLVLENASPRTEIQLLRYRHPDPLPDPHIRDLNKLGMNHICFAVDDIEAEIARLRASGFATRNEVMDFHSRKLVFLEGPEGVTVELSQWH